MQGLERKAVPIEVRHRGLRGEPGDTDPFRSLVSELRQTEQALFDAGNQDKIHRSPSAHPRTSGSQRLPMNLDWTTRHLRDGKTVITAIDTHAAGEPLRIITCGLPPLPGASILDRRRWMREHPDHLRRALLWDPRGHSDMYGCVPTPPGTPRAHLGVLFLHNEGSRTTCGHGVIPPGTALVEPGAVPAKAPLTPLTLDTPAGVVRAAAHVEPDGKVAKVSFCNVPSFLLRRDLALDVPGLGPLVLDVAFGGAFYAILPAGRIQLQVEVNQ